MTSAASNRLAVGLVMLGAAACPGPTKPCPFWGVRGGTPSLEIGMRLDGGTFGELTQDGQPAELTFPVQGGHVLFVGARIHDMPGCRQTLSADVFDASGTLYSTEVRQVDFTVADDGGAITDLSDTSSVANVPMCPDYGDRDVVNQDWVLRVTVSDDAGFTATASRHVTPVCRQTSAAALALCQCECAAHYMLGKCANLPDAGTDAGTDGGDGG